jgi:hypothetical protein
LDHVDQVEDDAVLGPHHQVEVAQTDVEIHDRDLLAGLCERGAERGGGCRLADATLAGGDHEDLGHACYLPIIQSKAAIERTRSSSQHWTGRLRSLAPISSAVR